MAITVAASAAVALVAYKLAVTAEPT
jgi:hypothetical protein